MRLDGFGPAADLLRALNERQITIFAVVTSAVFAWMIGNFWLVLIGLAPAAFVGTLLCVLQRLEFKVKMLSELSQVDTKRAVTDDYERVSDMAVILCQIAPSIESAVIVVDLFCKLKRTVCLLDGF
jgi:Ca2+-dependent lipid-binding protein